MPPKKGKGKKGAKKSAGDDETKEEKKRIIDEIHKAEDIEKYPMNLEMAQKLVETENIEFYVLVERMQNINRRLEQDTANLREKQKEEDEQIEKDAESLGILRKQQKRTRERAKGEKKDWLEQKLEAVTVNEQQRDGFNKEIAELRAKFEPQIEAKQRAIAELKEKEDDLLEFKVNEMNVQATLDFWKQEVQAQQAAQKALIEGIEKDRIKQIDKLRKDMLMQIRQVRMKNSVTNEDQLQGTTKLTVIQNMQLTAELDYQSKRTEDLMFKNQEMKSVITNLAKDLEDHKEVEKELAKRSHFCQKVIQKYKQQIEDLKQEIANADQQFKLESKRAAQDTEQQDLMNYLNQRIQSIEQKLQTTQSHLSLQEEEYQTLLEKMISIRNRYSKVILLLTEFIESFVEKDPAILQKQNDIFLDIDAVKDADDLRDVDEETLVALGLVLLKQLQPYVQDLSDFRHQENYIKKNTASAETDVIHEVEHVLNNSAGLQELEQRQVHLKMKEDENKLSFAKPSNPMRKQGSSGMMKYNSQSDVRDFDESGRPNVPTRGQTHGRQSQEGMGQSSYMRSSQPSGLQKSGAFNSGLQNYASTGLNSGMSKRDQGYTTQQMAVNNAYQAPGVSRLPAVADNGQQFMHLRMGNRSGIKSLDRTRGGMGGRRVGPMPQSHHSQNRRDSKFNYNSSSIPYLNKRDGYGGGQNLPGTSDSLKRPAGVEPVRLAGGMGNQNMNSYPRKVNTSGLPSVI